MEEKLSNNNLVSGSELAQWLDVSLKTIVAYAAENVVVRASRGRYELRSSTANYIRHLRKSASGRSSTTGDERTRLLRVQADAAELKLAVTREEYVLAWFHPLPSWRRSNHWRRRSPRSAAIACPNLRKTVQTCQIPLVGPPQRR